MLRTVTAATVDPVSLDEAKLHLRVDHTDDDTLITALISAATLSAQAQVQRRFITQTLEWVLPCWSPVIRLPVRPVAPDGVTWIKYVDWSQGQLTLDPSAYVVQTDGDGVLIRPAFGTIWPLLHPVAPEAVVVRFNAGGAVNAVPANVKAAILLTVGHLYEHRESVISDARVAAIELPQGVLALLMPEIWN